MLRKELEGELCGRKSAGLAAHECNEMMNVDKQILNCWKKVVRAEAEGKPISRAFMVKGWILNHPLFPQMLLKIQSSSISFHQIPTSVVTCGSMLDGTDAGWMGIELMCSALLHPCQHITPQFTLTDW